MADEIHNEPIDSLFHRNRPGVYLSFITSLHSQTRRLLLPSCFRDKYRTRPANSIGPKTIVDHRYAGQYDRPHSMLLIPRAAHDLRTADAAGDK
jgi:hypothetical protein